jgi:predicted transcriptional regulator
MCKSQCRNLKQQGNGSPSKANSTTKDLNNREVEEMSNIESQKIIVRMISRLKEETHNLVTEIEEDISKQLNALKKNTNNTGE